MAVTMPPETLPCNRLSLAAYGHHSWAREARTRNPKNPGVAAGFRVRAFHARPGMTTLMHRRRIELVLDALEMIEPLDGVVEF
jgi:hypothetical protein